MHYRSEGLRCLKCPNGVHVGGHDRDAIVLHFAVAEDELSTQRNLSMSREEERRRKRRRSKRKRRNGKRRRSWEGGNADSGRARCLLRMRRLTSDLLFSVLRLGRTSTSLKSNLTSESKRGIPATRARSV